MKRARFSGTEDRLEEEGAVESAVRLGSFGLLLGFVLGLVLSWELAFVLGFAGGLLGLISLPWALKRESAYRAASLERDLPEMLEVLALGLRSGLSFERCLKLYERHFRTPLAVTWARAQHQWETGLKDRDQALREMASAYDSQLLGRVVDTVIRALHSGLSVAKSLQQVAGETRAVVQARREEQVAKAPVKMMLPMGTLMLPAMLLLVLGPVLLQLMEGF